MRFENCVRFHVGGSLAFFLALSRLSRFVSTTYAVPSWPQYIHCVTHIYWSMILREHEKRKPVFIFCFNRLQKPIRNHNDGTQCIGRMDGNFRCGKTSGGKRFLCIRYKFDSILFCFDSLLSHRHRRGFHISFFRIYLISFVCRNFWPAKSNE